MAEADLQAREELFEDEPTGVEVEQLESDREGQPTIARSPGTLTGSMMIRSSMCQCGTHRQPISILDLFLPTLSPAGAEWSNAYRHWLG